MLASLSFSALVMVALAQRSTPSTQCRRLCVVHAGYCQNSTSSATAELAGYGKGQPSGSDHGGLDSEQRCTEARLGSTVVAPALSEESERRDVVGFLGWG